MGYGYKERERNGVREIFDHIRDYQGSLGPLGVINKVEGSL